ncbi:MAG: hypothetical protein B6242_05340 [Anaerolineaceae bacterium 4572_78]|nr:MAG: hypothetical protein B6242_05340 [Anaerolineaceae bacterium 4572_78]
MEDGFKAHILGYTLGIKFAFMLACPILSGVACGLWVDNQLTTTPFVMVFFMIIGFMFGMYAVYASAMRRHGFKQDKE